MKTVFFDVDTQLDFIYPAGSLYVPESNQIVPALGRLTRHALLHQIPIVATADAHSEDDAEFKTWPPHCVAGTQGQQKAAGTQLNGPAIISSRPDSFSPAPAAQYIIEKQYLDCFTNPNLVPLLRFLAADRFVVYGVVTELCVQCAAFGLLDFGAEVVLVKDAVRTLNSALGDGMIRDFEARGGSLTTVAAITC